MRERERKQAREEEDEEREHTLLLVDYGDHIRIRLNSMSENM